MEFIDHTDGPKIAQRVFRKITETIMEFGDIPPTAVHTALILIVDSFCDATQTPHEDFVRNLYSQRDRRKRGKS